MDSPISHLSVLDLPPGVLGQAAGFLCTADVLSLAAVCKDLRLPHLWDDKARQLPVGYHKLPLLEFKHVGKAYMNRVREANGIPCTQLSIAWLPNASYWVRSAPCPSSPFHVEHTLRTVCWLDISGNWTVPLNAKPSKWQLMLRIRSQGHCGSLARQLNVSQTGPGYTLTTQAPPFDVLDSREIPQGAWLWLNLGSVEVQPCGGSTAGPADSAGSSAAPAVQGSDAAGGPTESQAQSSSDAPAPSAQPPQSVPIPHPSVAFHIWDHSGGWKSGLHVDHMRAVPLADLATVTGITDFEKRPYSHCSWGPGPRYWADGLPAGPTPVEQAQPAAEPLAPHHVPGNAAPLAAHLRVGPAARFVARRYHAHLQEPRQEHDQVQAQPAADADGAGQAVQPEPSAQAQAQPGQQQAEGEAAGAGAGAVADVLDLLGQAVAAGAGFLSTAVGALGGALGLGQADSDDVTSGQAATPVAQPAADGQLPAGPIDGQPEGQHDRGGHHDNEEEEVDLAPEARGPAAALAERRLRGYGGRIRAAGPQAAAGQGEAQGGPQAGVEQPE